MNNLKAFTFDEIQAALQFIDASCDRDTWVRVAMGIKSEFGDAGEMLFFDWSESGATFNVESCKATWKSVKPGGAVGIGSVVKWAMDGGWRPGIDDDLSDDEKKRRQVEFAKRKAQVEEDHRLFLQRQAAEHEAAAEVSQRIFEMLSDSGASEYLNVKKVQGFGVRYVDRALVIVNHENPVRYDVHYGADAVNKFFKTRDPDVSMHYHKKGTLVVPVQSLDGKLWSLQFIAKNYKKFIKWGKKSGCFHQIGERSIGKPLVFSEGYATAGSVVAATALPTLVTFDAGNMLAVTREFVGAGLRDAYEYIFAGDDDPDVKGNPGRTKADAAAQLVGGRAVFPAAQS